MLLEDRSFYINPDVERIIETAKDFIKWAEPQHPPYFVQFSQSLMTALYSCFQSRKSIQAEREYTCTQYHFMRTSPDYHNAWSTFLLNAINTNPGPIFYQYVTHTIMTELISQHYPLKDNQSSTPHGQDLTNIEENALRYIAGYICKKIQDQVVQFSHPHRQALLLFISDMAGIEMDNSQTESWTNIMDRGGLHHVNDMAYHFFYLMETELRNHLSVKAAFMEPNLKLLNKRLSESDKVLYQWHMLTDDQGTNTIHVDELYEMFISKFVNLRSHSFASSIVETYKAITSQSLDKKKSLRKSLF